MPDSAAQRSTAPAYRADIDGLRALAVVAVVLFHSRVRGFEGGYAGVDVFFVISGYLITRLLEQSRGQSTRETLTVFYLRRIRRILPALLATCLVTAAAAFLLFLPGELNSLGPYLVATPLLLSNAASWADGGYFASGPSVPLNHLWSIAVEEQFYLVYPLVLLFITRYVPLHRRITLIVAACASLMLCIWASRTHPSANYFFAPTRAWELLLGAALALGTVPRMSKPVAVELLAFVSVLGLAIAVQLYGPKTAYPGSATILPCVATAALIVTGAQPRPALVNRALAWRPIVFLGLISYSLYLWHRPLLVFISYYRIEPLGPLDTALVLAATVAMAALSWRFIEQPIRRRALLSTPAALLWVVAVVSAAVLLGGVLLWKSNGLPQRFPRESQMLFAEAPIGSRWVRCMERPEARAALGRFCRTAAPETAPRVLVWGDSHALAMMPAYEVLANQHHERLYFAGKSSCPPLLPEARSSPPTEAVPPQGSDCTVFNAEVLDQIMLLDARTVILDARWIDANLPPGVPNIASGIEQTMARIGDSRTVCVVLGVPTLKYAPPYALVMAHRRGLSDDFLRLSRVEALAQFKHMELTLDALPAGSRPILADPKDILCPGESCLYLVNGRTLYIDNNHLSPYGARYVMPALERCFRTRSGTSGSRTAQ